MTATVRDTASGAAYADVATLLAARSLVVVGASDRENNLGGATIRYLEKFGYDGDIHIVNPRRDSVAGRRAYPDVASIPDLAQPAVAVVAIPAAATIGLMDECADVGIRHAVIFSGGFAEQQTQDGIDLQARLVETCKRRGMTVVGPNCLGVIDTHDAMIASFSSLMKHFDVLESGNVSVVSQSGGIATMVQALAADSDVYFRYMISSGNEAVTTMGDYVHAFVEDEQTEVIALYLEGVTDGEKFVRALAEARAANKPVVVLKAGRTEATARAAQAHTGALVGQDRVWHSVLQEHGAILVDTIDEMLDVVLFLSTTDHAKLPKGDAVAVVVFGGGMGVLAMDDCDRNGLRTPEFTASTKERLAPLVPPIAGISNPVDLTPAAYEEPYLHQMADAMEVMASDPQIDMVLAEFATTWLDGFAIADSVVEVRERTDKTVALAWPFAPVGVSEYLLDKGVYAYPEYARATRVLGRLVDARRLTPDVERGDGPPLSIDWRAAVGDVAAGTVLPEHKADALLRSAGLPVADGRLAADTDEAVAVAIKVGLPVVLKGVVESVTHRASAGLLELDLRSAEEVRAATQRLMARAASSSSILEGVFVQHMVEGDAEILVSGFRDPVFGSMVSVGAGGVLTELIDDVVIAAAPFGQAYARHLLGRVRSLRLDPDADLSPLTEFLARFSALIAEAPWESFVLEVNPLKFDGRTAVAVDSLLIVDTP